jgi:hypothetical protein
MNHLVKKDRATFLPLYHPRKIVIECIDTECCVGVWASEIWLHMFLPIKFEVNGAEMDEETDPCFCMGTLSCSLLPVACSLTEL